MKILIIKELPAIYAVIDVPLHPESADSVWYGKTGRGDYTV